MSGECKLSCALQYVSSVALGAVIDHYDVWRAIASRNRLSTMQLAAMITRVYT